MTRTVKLVLSVLTIAVVLVAIVAVALIDPTADRDDGFTIDRFERTVVLGDDGTLAVTEVLDVEFTQPRRGIFRDLEGAGPGGSRVTYHVDGVDRGSEDQPWPWTGERTEDGDPRIRVGDADVTLPPGPQTYRFRYTAEGLAFRPAARPEQVQLRLDVPGDLWPTDVAATRLTVQLPAAPTSVRCVAGGPGTTGGCGHDPVVTDTTVVQDLDALRPGATATVAVELPVTALPAGDTLPVDDVDELEERERFAPFDVPTVPAALLLALLIAAPAAALEARRARLVYRDEVTDPVLHDRTAPTAELEPPDGLAPVELAALLRRSIDREQLLATVIDLEVRGIVTTTSGPDGKPLTIGPGPRAAHGRPWEAATLEALCPRGEPITYDDEYDQSTGERSNAATGALSAHAGQVLGPASRYTHQRGGWLRGAGYVAAVAAILVLGLVVSLLVGHLLGLDPITRIVAWVGLALAWLVLALLWGFERLPLTSEGRDAIARARAYRTFLDEVHADRLEFAASQAAVGTTHPAVALLPYAVALGLADSWHRRFEPLMTEAARTGRAGGTGSPDTWYLHHAAFTTAVATQATSTTPPSSSGSGGGSFGGGGAGSGGGGGGGGSW